jgi:hypothetical protein
MASDPQILDDLKTLVESANANAIYDSTLYGATEDKIRAIGQTAAFFGGFDGMTKLHDAFEKAGGDTYKLNRLWDQIGGWCA